MKSIFTVLGTFLFSIFTEGFVRVIIIFYHEGSFIFFGVSSLPSLIWVLVILVCVLITSWLSGMLAITIASSSKLKHLLALGVLLLLWRLNELIQTYQYEPLWYLILLIIVTFAGLISAYITHKHAIQNTTN